MTQYSLAAGIYTATTLPAQIGNTYQIGIGDGTRFYGYNFQNKGQQTVGFSEASDTTSKESLTQFSSGQLIDRDIAYFPRVTDGDFSGGGYQEVWLDNTKYFDSDLDPRIPGYLQLRPQWTRITKAGLTVVSAGIQMVAWNGDFWYTFGEANGNIYSANGGTTTSPVVASMVALATDGQYLYAGTSGALYQSANGSSWTGVTSSVNGSPNVSQWWVFNQGTSGRFAYYTTTGANLWKIDLNTAFPIAAAAQPQVPMGSTVGFKVADMVAYQNGLAILTSDNSASPVSSDVWFHDGTNLTRMIPMPGYLGTGLCVALGNLYVALQSGAGAYSPILALVSGGTFQVVAKPGSPFPTSVAQAGMGPVSSGQYVYWPLVSPSIKGISTAKGTVLQYDVLSGAVTHLPNLDASDYTSFSTKVLRQLATLGESVGIVFWDGATNGFLQYQAPAFGSIKYQTSGWLASSHIDFGTPGIIKRFRRIEVHHAPLAAGESVLVEAFVDTDPLVFTTALAPVPTQATATNTTLNSSLTAMTFGVDTVGKTMYFALKLGAGTSNNTSPRVSYASIEVGGTWVWEFDLDCSSRRRTLAQGGEDPQGISGKDLYFLLRNAYENGTNLTLYLFSSVSYTVAVESLKGTTPGYTNHAGTTVKADEEWQAHVVLRQVA